MIMSNQPSTFIKLDPVIPTPAYDTYWKFAYERQNVFFRRYSGERETLTNDPIIQKYKFTNAYRVCDRVSQYLIRRVIYSGENFSIDDILLRIVLFKLFNKIDTWKLLVNHFGEICVETFDVDAYKNFLDSEINRGFTLYNNAYMMASGSKEFKVTRKHHAHLMLVQMMLNDCLAAKLQDCSRMSEAYQLLLAYPLIGSFLAYQYVTDINYSEIVDFTETEFVIPGPGARDGIRKCFSSLSGLSETDIIKQMTERQELEFARLQLDFKWLGSRKLQYIDIQNIFCETDKYCRVAHPNISGISGRTRIKQLYQPAIEAIDFMFPPKWDLALGDI